METVTVEMSRILFCCILIVIIITIIVLMRLVDMSCDRSLQLVPHDLTKQVLLNELKAKCHVMESRSSETG